MSKCPKKQIQTIKEEAFNLIDVQRKGIVTLSNFQYLVLTIKIYYEVYLIFKDMDEDGNQILDIFEFMEFLKSKKIQNIVNPFREFHKMN